MLSALSLSICLREGESERFLVEGRSGHSAIAFSMARNNQMNYVISMIITMLHDSIIRWFIRVQCARVHDLKLNSFLRHQFCFFVHNFFETFCRFPYTILSIYNYQFTFFVNDKCLFGCSYQGQQSSST